MKFHNKFIDLAAIGLVGLQVPPPTFKIMSRNYYKLFQFSHLNNHDENISHTNFIFKSC